MAVFKKFLITALILLVSLTSLSAQESPGASPALSGGLSASLATEVIGGETFQSIGLIPDVGFGPFGIGIDLTFHFRFYDKPGGDFGFYPRAEDWYDKSLSVQQNVDKYLSRIVYLRWNHKGDPLYIQAGLLPDTNLGNSFIVGGYNNGMLKPDLRYTGLILDMDGKLFNFPYIGFESFVSNISTFDVMAARVYVRPLGLAFPDNALLKEIQFGVTGAFDTNPYAQAQNSTLKASTGTGTVSVIGVDTRAPLLNTDIFTAALFGDYVMQGSHTGGMVGLGGQLVKVVNWGIQSRFLGQNFIADYFDKGYDINRTSKYAVYKDVTTVPAYMGWQASLGASFLDDKIGFGASLSGPWSSVGSSTFAYPQLQSYAELKEGLLPVSLSAYYNKDNLTDLNSLFSAENALIGAKVGYTVGAATIYMVYNLRYIPADDPAYTGNHWETTSRLETAVKLF